MSPLLTRYFARLDRGQPWRWRGKVLESVGQTIESAGPLASVGECCEVTDQYGLPHLAEVIGFRGSNVLSMPVGTTEGIRFGDQVAALGIRPEIEVGSALMGRVLNAMGEPIDEGGAPAVSQTLPLDGAVRSPLDRVPIRIPLGTGIRVLDALLTVGRGQRVGIFGGSGVGKSTLIGMMTRNTEADVTVVGLVGERGREVGEFLEDALGVEGRARSVVVVSTSDQSPLMRMRAALSATTLAEYALCDGSTGDWPRSRRTAHGKGIYAFRIYKAGAAGGALRAISGGFDYSFLYGFDGRRRPAGSPGGCCAFAAGWTYCALSRHGRGGLVSAG